MNKVMILLILMVAGSLNAQTPAGPSHIDFAFNGGPHPSLAGHYFFASSPPVSGYTTQWGLGLGEVGYEAFQKQKAVGFDTELCVAFRKNIVKQLSFRHALFAGYESLQFLDGQYGLTSTRGGFPYFGFGSGLTFSDHESHWAVTIGVGMKGVRIDSAYLKGRLMEEGLDVPSFSIYPFLGMAFASF